MSQTNKILFFIVLPIIALLAWPPKTLASGFLAIPLVIVLIGLLSVPLFRGRSSALTFAIFLQGMNVIIRLMMLFPNSMSIATGTVNIAYLVTSLIGLGVSFYLVLRLDRVDVRSTMVT